ncbi:MAG: hypothetical protein Q9228_007898 [Teloschistes exilis]
MDDWSEAEGPNRLAAILTPQTTGTTTKSGSHFSADEAPTSPILGTMILPPCEPNRDEVDGLKSEISMLKIELEMVNTMLRDRKHILDAQSALEDLTVSYKALKQHYDTLSETDGALRKRRSVAQGALDKHLQVSTELYTKSQELWKAHQELKTQHRETTRQLSEARAESKQLRTNAAQPMYCAGQSTEGQPQVFELPSEDQPPWRKAIHEMRTFGMEGRRELQAKEKAKNKYQQALVEEECEDSYDEL